MADEETTSLELPPEEGEKSVKPTDRTRALLEKLQGKVNAPAEGEVKSVQEEQKEVPTQTDEKPTEDNEEKAPGLFEGLKPEAPESKETKETKEEATPGKDFPKGKQQWDEWKRKETEALTEKLTKEFQGSKFTELQSAREEAARLEKELETAQTRLEKVAFTETAKYRNTFVEPKAAAVAQIQRVAPNHEGAKQIMAAMEAGTLGPESFPDISDLNPIQANAVTQAVTAWMTTHDEEKAALEGWEGLREQYQAESSSLQVESRQAAIQEISQQLQTHAVNAVAQLENELPEYTEQDRAAAAQMLNSPEAQAYMGKAVMAVPALTRQLRESIVAQRGLETKLATLEEELTGTKDALGAYEGAGRMTGGGTNGGSSAKKPRAHDQLMSKIAGGLQQG